MPRSSQMYQQSLQCLLILALASVLTVALQQHQQSGRSDSRLRDDVAALTQKAMEPQSKAVSGAELEVPSASTSMAGGDALFIRHGRSRVRHSNEKAAAEATKEAFYSNNSSSSSQTRTRLTMVTALPAVTPTMLPSDSTSAPVTHKIRKLHKKKINESIRKSVDKSLGVVRPAKNHRSLAEAEHLQGRPTDVDEDVNDGRAGTQSALGEVMQLADEIDLDNSIEAAYQSADIEETTAGVEGAEDDDSGTDIETAATTTARPTAYSQHEADVAAASTNEANQAAIWQQGQNRLDFNHTRRRTISSNAFDAHLMHSNTEDSTESDYGLDESRHGQHGDGDVDENVEGDIEDGLDDVVGDTSVQYVLDEAMTDNVTLDEHFRLEASTTQSSDADWPEEHSLGPRESASTSILDVGIGIGLGLEEQQINFDDSGVLDTSEVTMDDGYPPEVLIDDNTKQLVISDVEGDAEGDGVNEGEGLESEIRVDVINARDSKIDLVSKFLQYIEHQHLLGSNCVAGTSLNLGEGVVDRYAQDRFRVEAEVAVNRANMLTRIFKMTSHSVQEDVNLLHASVLSMVEFDDDIFAAGNCFDWNEHPAQPGLFCPFAYRLPPPNLGAVFAKDLAMEYHYLGNTSEWFFLARKNAEKVIARNEQYLKSFHLYSNRTDERIEADTLAVKYEDGRWSKPYYDCGGGNIWMLTYTVPFFGYENGTYHFKGTSGIDIDLRRVDIDQCPQRSVPGAKRQLNIFAGTDKCKQRTTMCEAINGLGFRRGSYKCICRKGYYFPDVVSTQKFFNGSLLEEEYEKLMLGRNSTYSSNNEYECLPCAEGCDSCEDGSPCIAALNWPMRTSILLLACVIIGLLPPAAWFTFRYQQVKVVRAASPALLRVIALGAFFIYCTNIVMYPNPNLYTCTARIWLREIGFSLTYGALMLKTWRISVIFRVRSAKAVKITDAALLKRLGIICGVIGTCLLVRTLVSPPDVVVGRTADDLKAFLCKTDWWDYTFTSMEVLFLAWGVRLCIMVRKAPSEFNESRFISMAIYNEFLLTCFLNVSMLFLQSPANPDLLYIIFFCHTQLTVTLLLALIFGSKVYIVLRSGKSHQESIGMGAKSSGAKFNFRPQVRTFANPSSVTTSTAPVAGTTSAENKLSDQEALEEIRQLSVQLQRIQEMAPPKGVAVMTISSLLDGLKTPGGMMIVAAAATHAATANQNALRHQTQPLLSLNAEMQKYNQQLQLPTANNNVTPHVGDGIAALNRNTRTSIPTMVLETPPSPTPPSSVTYEERAVNTEVSGSNFAEQILSLTADGHIVCNRCLEASKEHYYCCRPRDTPNGTPPPSALTTCEQLGSPLPEGSISFANIKLECMCSQSDDLDLDLDRAVLQRRRPTVRSAATNTPPPTAKNHQRHRSTEDGGEADVSYQICDNCRSKYKISSKSCKRRSFSKRSSLAASEPASGMLSQTRSSDLINRVSHGGELAASVAKTAHSTDDITFYTTTEDDDDDDDASSNSSQQSPGSSKPSTSQKAQQRLLKTTGTQPPIGAQSVGNVSNNSNNSASQTTTEATSKPNGSGGSSTRPKRPDKLVLDLNDRSKYTKEVSV